MRTSERPGQDEGVWSRFVKAIRHTVAKGGVRIAIAVLATTVILSHIDYFKEYVKQPTDQLLVVLVLILLLSEESRLANEESHRQIRLLKEQTDEQATKIESVIDIASLKLYGLYDCIRDFEETLDSIRPREKIIIEHLGLNLAQAWQYFEPLIRTHCNLTDIDYRLLILTDETENIAGADDEVRNWSENVRQILVGIKKDVDGIIEEFRGVKEIKFEVRKYGAIPVVHGFRIVSPMLLCYMAICRWGGSDYQKYEWGEPQYHKIIGDPPSDVVSRDMLKIYNGYFNNLWMHHSLPGFVLPSPAEPQGAKG